jgi:2-polyprenyl-3-methyl-5-hydroxy-6-metoxy-1,4-benzoquinol methylase
MTTLEISPTNKQQLRKYLNKVCHVATNHWVAHLTSRAGENVVRVHDNDEHVLICADNKFDCVWSANVLEHVEKPWLWIPELARITKSGGFVATISPITWEQHRTRIRARERRDSWRIFPDGIRTLFEEAGLVCEKAELVSFGTDTEWELTQNRGPAIDLVAIGRKL